MNAEKIMNAFVKIFSRDQRICAIGDRCAIGRLLVCITIDQSRRQQSINDVHYSLISVPIDSAALSVVTANSFVTPSTSSVLSVSGMLQ